MSDILSMSEVSQFIGVTPQTLRNWDRNPEKYPDKLRPIPRASRNERRKYRKSDVDAFVKTIPNFVPPKQEQKSTYKERPGDTLRNPGVRTVLGTEERMSKSQLNALKRSMTKVLTSVTDVLDLVDAFEQDKDQKQGK